MEYAIPDRRLHHAGYVVTDIATGMQGFIRSLGATWDEKIFEDPHQKVKVAFLSTGSGDALIELVEPATPDSPVRRFLEQKGGGLHHVCYEVADLEQHLSVMRGNGAMLVRSPKPAVAFDGRRIAWVLTRERLLVELLESAFRSG